MADYMVYVKFRIQVLAFKEKCWDYLTSRGIGSVVDGAVLAAITFYANIFSILKTKSTIVTDNNSIVNKQMMNLRLLYISWACIQ